MIFQQLLNIGYFDNDTHFSELKIHINYFIFDKNLLWYYVYCYLTITQKTAEVSFKYSHQTNKGICWRFTRFISRVTTSTSINKWNKHFIDAP